jgi:pantothenate kinase
MQQELLDTVTDLVTPLLAGTRVIVGIVGPPGAGKSTLAEGVAARFDRFLRFSSERSPFRANSTTAQAATGPASHLPAAYQHRAAMTVPMDGFHLSNMELARLGLADIKGAPESFDGWGFVHLLRRIRAGEELVYAPVFNRVLNESIGSAVPVFPSVELVVVEGNYLLLPEDPWVRARPLYDLTIYLDVPDEVRVPRLVRRQRARGLDAAAALDWVRRSDEANARLIATTRTYADVVLPRD